MAGKMLSEEELQGVVRYYQRVWRMIEATRPKFNPEVDSFWMKKGLSAKEVRKELEQAEEFLKFVSGHKMDRPEAVKKFFGEGDV